MAKIADEPKPLSQTILPLAAGALEGLSHKVSQGERLSEKEVLQLWATIKDPNAFQEAVRLFQHVGASPQRNPTSPDVPPEAQSVLVLSNRCELMLDAPQWFHSVSRIDDPAYRVLTLDGIDGVLETLQDSGTSRLWIGGGLDSQLLLPGLEGASLLPTLKKLLGYLNDKKPEGVSLEGFSLDYWEFLSVVTGKSPAYLLNFLQDYGVTALSGWGSDCLVSPTREAISKKKLSLHQWQQLTQLAWSCEMSLVPSLTVGLGQSVQTLYAHLDILKEAAQAFSKSQNEKEMYDKEMSRLILPLELYSTPWDRAVYPEAMSVAVTQRIKRLQWLIALYWTHFSWNQGVGCATLSLPNWTPDNQQEFALEQRDIQVYPQQSLLPSQIATQGLLHGLNLMSNHWVSSGR
jgi:hypothetical protein